MFGLDPSSLSLHMYFSKIAYHLVRFSRSFISSLLHPFASGIIFLHPFWCCSVFFSPWVWKNITLTDRIIPLFNKTKKKLWSWFSLACFWLLDHFFMLLSGLFTKVVILKRGPYKISMYLFNNTSRVMDIFWVVNLIYVGFWEQCS